MLLFNVFILHTAAVTTILHVTIQSYTKIAVKIFDSIFINGISEKPVHVYVSVGEKAEQ